MAQLRRLPLATAPMGPAAPLGAAAPPGPEGAEPTAGDLLLQVGDLAKATGKTVRAIHHYEELGLLKPHARSKGRYRLYDESALARVRWISKLSDLGLSLHEVQRMVREWEAAPNAPDAMAMVRRLYASKLEETRAQLAYFRELETELQASLDYLDACVGCGSQRHLDGCPSCSTHEDAGHEPGLIAGVHSSMHMPPHQDAPSP